MVEARGDVRRLRELLTLDDPGCAKAIERRNLTELKGTLIMQTITREELKEKMDRGDDFVLVEALPERLYRRAHLPGAVNLPSGRVRELMPELLPDKETDVVVYCGSFR